MKKLREKIVFKSLFGIFFLLVFFAFVVGYIGYDNNIDTFLKQYEEGAYRIADTALNGFSPEKLDDYANSGGETEEYKEVLEQMDELCNSSGATFVYIIRPDTTDYGHITFIFSTANKNYDYDLYPFGYYRETTNDEYRTVYRQLYESQTDRAIVVRDRGYIETDAHITALVAIKDSNKKVQGIMCVQRQMEEMTTARKSFVRRVIVALIATLIFIMIALAVYLKKLLLGPLKSIIDEADRFAKNGTISEVPLKDTIINKDEIALLAESIDKMEVQIHSNINEIKKITAEKERISTELSLATKIQLSMLPNIFPPFPDRKEFDIYASMNPAKEVGGDFYDFFLKDDDHLCIVMADVSGKGVPAALFMMASKIIIANNVLSEESPAKVLEKTNSMICANNKEGFFVTVWLGIMEISTGKITASNAGHEYPVLCSDGKFSLLKDRHGFVVGGMDSTVYTDYEIQLKQGDKLFLYTDGVTEASTSDGKLFGMERMVECLNKYASGDSKSIIEGLGDEIKTFANDAEQFDDITMLCLEYF